jgi:hypothetical protein
MTVDPVHGGLVDGVPYTADTALWTVICFSGWSRTLEDADSTKRREWNPPFADGCECYGDRILNPCS